MNRVGNGTSAAAGSKGGRRRRRAWLCAGVLPLAAAMSAVSAWHAAAAERANPADLASQRAQAPKTFAFDIAPQPLSSALAAFIKVSGWQIGYTEDTVRGLQSRGVRGTYTPEQALGALLAGTGVLHRVTNGDTVALERVSGGPSGAVTLDPITVTGERFRRSIQDTASSVAVFDAQTLEKRPDLNTSNAVLEHVPNVVTSETSNFAPAVRGIDGTGPAQGADAFFAGTRPRLNMQVDGRPLSYNEAIFGDVPLWDVDQVEVFRGPQSTMQGRNAIAGAVVVKTKDPTYDWETAAQFTGGNFDSRQYSAMVSGPILEDQLAFRLAVDRQTSQSFLKFQSFPEVDDPGEFEATTLRGKLLFQPKGLDGFTNLLTVSYLDYLAPQTETVGRPFEDENPATPDMPTFNPRSLSGVMETTWKVDKDYTLENTLSLTDVRVQRRSPAGEGNAIIEGYEIREEPRLRFSLLGGVLNGFGGLHYFQADQDEFIDFGGDNSFDDSTRTMAAFGEGTLTVLENIDLTLGGRLEQENRKRDGGVAPVFDIDFDETYNAFLPKAGVAWHATDKVTVGAVVARGFNGGGAGFSFGAPFVSYTYEPEYVWNYEAYTRAELFDRKLALTGNVFFSDYKDIQLPFSLGPLSTVIRNADRAITYGAEAGAKWLPVAGLQLFGDIGLLKTEITEYPDSGFEGNDLPRSPAFTADFGAVYQHRSGFDVGADVRYSETYYSNVANTPRGKVDPYWVVNMQAGYTYENVRLFAFVKNVFDDESITMLHTDGATEADDSANIVHPRVWGVGLKVTF